MEIAHTQTWLKAAAGIVLGVGLLLAAGAWPPLATPVVFLADLIIWPLDELQTLAAPETRVFMAISGGVMVGWGVTLWKLADYMMPEHLAAVRSITMTGLYSWFVVDSIAIDCSRCAAQRARQCEFRGSVPAGVSPPAPGPCLSVAAVLPIAVAGQTGRGDVCRHRVIRLIDGSGQSGSGQSGSGQSGCPGSLRVSQKSAILLPCGSRR
jgi:hypothetical protein